MYLETQNVIDIVSYLSGQLYSNLNAKWQKHLKKMFPSINKDDVIHVMMNKGKADKMSMILKVNHEEVRISIKMGKEPSIHFERYDIFRNYIYRTLNVPGRYIKILDFYQYGTSKKLNNDKPLNRRALHHQYGSYFKEFSDYMFNHQEIMSELAKRFIFEGFNHKEKTINFYYYGNVGQGYLLSKDELLELMFRPFDDCLSPHFGTLVYEPTTRQSSEDKRSHMRIRWPYLYKLFFDEDFINSH